MWKAVVTLMSQWITDAFGNYGYYYTEEYPYGPMCTYGEPDDSFIKESCEFNTGGNPCRQFSFITYSKQGDHNHDHGHGHKHENEHGSHEHGSYKIQSSVGAETLFSVNVLLIVSTGVMMIRVFDY